MENRKKISLDEIKKIQLNILKYVAEFCESRNINYFLAYGSLLGAIRHKGYIPWDDDIDIAMFREDFETFTKEYSKGEHIYKLYYFQREKSYPYPFAKISSIKTILFEESDLDFEKFGVNIDLFPLDYLPKNIILRKITFFEIYLLKKMWFLKFLPINKNRCLYKNLILFFGKKTLKFININLIIKKIIEKSTKYKDTESGLIANLVWGDGECEVIDKKNLEKIDKGFFEDTYYNIPFNYHLYLSKIYGDYMKFPREKERISHHKYMAYWK